MKTLFSFCVAVIALSIGMSCRAQLVTSTADSGPGTLRYALTNTANGGTITFAASLSGATITLASTLGINTNLTIDASTLTGGIQISGNGSVEIFNVTSNITVFLRSLTLMNGSTATNGGAVQNNGTLTLTNCTVSGNSSRSAFGGGICNNGALTLNGCVLSKNSASRSGGAIYNYLGTMTLNLCTLSGNTAVVGYGGGFLSDGTVTLNQCTLTGNTAAEDAGGIYNTGTLTLNGCTVSSNSATGSFGGAGGIYHYGGALTLNQCTLWGNKTALNGDAGGVYINGGTAMLNQCTVSGNTASFAGGGVENASGALTITNTIVAGNNGQFGGDIFVSSTLTYGGSNLVQSIYNYNNEGIINGPTPLTNAPNLAPLGNYGGPTPTMPPLPGSPALGAGGVAANIFASDQRGYPRTQNGLIDIGAVELPTVQPFTAGPTNVWQSIPVQFSAPVVDSDGSSITKWNWGFGDNQTSTVQNPAHMYNATGIFSPGLILTNSLGLTLAAAGPAITVYPPLTLAGMSLSGTNLTLEGANGISKLTYSVLTSTNLTQPSSQWTPLTTNIWATNGNFNLIVTNALNSSVPRRFYLFKVP